MRPTPLPLSPHFTGININDNISNHKLPLRKYHFCLDPICSKYSFIHRLHTSLVTSCLLQCFLGLNGSVSTLPGTKPPPICTIRKWFGVKTHSLLGSSLTVKGLEFSRLSTSVKIVSNSSSLTSESPSTAKIAHFADLIIDSKTPLICGTAGKFHFQLTPLLEVIPCILSWSTAETRSRSSLNVLTKFVPLSLHINFAVAILSTQSFWQRC